MDAKLIDHWFTYQPPTPEQIPKYIELREKAREYAHAINRLVPDGADKTAALRQLRLTNMAANTALACHLEPEDDSTKA